MKEPQNTQPERRKTHTPGILVNRICLAVVAVLFFAVAVLNLFQFNRPTVSESEKRELAKMPEFTFAALFDGSYFSGVSDFISDTFWQRDRMVGAARKLDAVKGFDYYVNGERYAVIDTPDYGDPDPDETTQDLSYLQDITLPPIVTRAPEESTAPPVPPESTAPQVITDAPGTDSPEITDTPGTDSPVITEAPGTEPPPVTTEEPFSYVSLKLSDTAASLTEDQSLILTAALRTSGKGTADPIRWSLSDATLGLLTPSDDGTSAVLLAQKTGTVTVTAASGPLTASCKITIEKKQSSSDDPVLREIEGNVFLYGDAFYQGIRYSGDSLKAIAEQYAKLCQYYSAVFGGVPVSFLPAPHAAILLDTAKVTKAGRDQKLILNDMAQYYPASVNFVNTYSAIKAHASEPIYFKTDHHWTSLGAYYAYTEFAKSRGFSPVPLSSLTKVHVTDSFVGSYSSYLNTYRIDGIKDVIDNYHPTKAHRMTAYYTPADAKKVGAASFSRDTCIMDSSWKSYTAFLSGDRPMVVIQVPENGAQGKGKSILVLKDSYGSALVPYLCEHYETIVAIDPRYYKQTFPKNVQDQLKDYRFDDILFVMNIEMANSSNWLGMFYNIVGVK